MPDWKAWVRAHPRDLHIHPARAREADSGTRAGDALNGPAGFRHPEPARRIEQRGARAVDALNGLAGLRRAGARAARRHGFAGFICAERARRIEQRGAPALRRLTGFTHA